MTTPPPEPERDGDEADLWTPRLPDARPFKRIQSATVILIVAAILLTLTSGSRPAEVRWGTLIGLVALVAVIAVVMRRRRGGRPARSGP